MWFLVIVPFFLQAMVILIDEFYFHVKRGLPKWERIGHPIDTFSVLLCLLMAFYCPFSAWKLKYYIAMCVFSCILVTKDEFVHKHHCPASENWLHAFLFILHPIVLTASGLIWAYTGGALESIWAQSWFASPINLKAFIGVQIALMSLFLTYQVVYWNLLWKKEVLTQH